MSDVDPKIPGFRILILNPPQDGTWTVDLTASVCKGDGSSCAKETQQISGEWSGWSKEGSRAAAKVLAHPLKVSDTFFADEIAYMDKLKDCTPSTSNMALTFFGQDIKSMMIIHGPMDGVCLVDKFYNGTLVQQCAYSPDSIKTLTSKAKYDDARAKRAQGSTSDPASQAETRDCKMALAAAGKSGTPATARTTTGRKGLGVMMGNSIKVCPALSSPS